MINKLLARFGYVRKDARAWEESYDMGDIDATARASRWIAFYNEQGGLRDMIASLRRSYFEKVGSLKPNDTDSLEALGMADRICRELDSQIKQVIDDGKIEQQQREHADRIASLSDAKRRRI